MIRWVETYMASNQGMQTSRILEQTKGICLQEMSWLIKENNTHTNCLLIYFLFLVYILQSKYLWQHGYKHFCQWFRHKELRTLFISSLLCSLERDTDVSSGNLFIRGWDWSQGGQLIAYSAVCLRGSYLHSFETTMGKDRFSFRSFLARRPLSKIRKKKLIITHTVLLIAWSHQMEDGTARGWNYVACSVPELAVLRDKVRPLDRHCVSKLYTCSPNLQVRSLERD